MTLILLNVTQYAFFTPDPEEPHDLDMLRNLLPATWSCHQTCPTLRTLTLWATEGRYPSSLEDPTQEDAQAALALAQEVLLSVQADLMQRGFSRSP